MKKISNKFKVLIALCSGPKTQAELVRETKVKNVYQMMSGLIKSREVIKREDGKVLLRDSLNPQYTKEHKIAHYKYLAGVTKVKPKEPEDYIRQPRMSTTSKLRMAVDETDKVSAEQLSATLSKPESEIRRVLQEREERLKREALSTVYKFDGKIVLDRVSFIQHEIDNINDGVRSLMVARSYLLRRIEEEKREAYEEEKRREKRDA
jgi:hypothetical protein